jgi:hypothetical protein
MSNFAKHTDGAFPGRTGRSRLSSPSVPRALLVGAFASLSLCLGSSPARAQLDPGLQKPYQLHVVLHFAEHRFLTSTFQDQVERQLHDHLQLTLGKLAKVQIFRDHPLLGEVRTRGLQQTLDGWDDLSDIKTHFVLIDFVKGRYEIRARQHDGATGLSSPVVRVDATIDRKDVARLAALLVDRDFGLVGTVQRGDDGEVRVALQGGTLDVPLERWKRWIKPGDVFAVARLTQEGERQRSTRLDWTVLQVLDEPAQGVWRCRFFTRFTENQLTQEPPVLGYRCLKLTTTTAPLRLRLLDADARSDVPLSGVEVHVSGQPFEDPAPVKLSTKADGLAVTDKAFANVAFVQVFSGSEERARFPVDLVDDRVVVCRLRASADADARGQLELRKERWARRIDDVLLADVNRVQYLNERLRTSREDALAVARAGLKGLKDDLESLRMERDRLREAAVKVGKGPVDLREGEQRLAQLAEHREKLAHFVANVENVLKEESSEKAKVLGTVERARLLESQADYEEAIKLYRQVLQESPDQTKVKARLEELERHWNIPATDKEWAQARDFIFNTWTRKLDTAELKAELPKAREALAVCRKRGDWLTPRKLLQADLAHGAALKKRLEVLRQRESEDNRNEARMIGQLAEELERLHREATAATKKTES